MALVVEHHEALEADLRGQGVDLLDFWRGRLTPRALEAVVRHLPATSRFWSVVDPDGALVASWDESHYQMALLIDMFGKANFKDWKPLPRPLEVVQRRRADDKRRARLLERAEARRQQISDAARNR